MKNIGVAAISMTNLEFVFFLLLVTTNYDLSLKYWNFSYWSLFWLVCTTRTFFFKNIFLFLIIWAPLIFLYGVDFDV